MWVVFDVDAVSALADFVMKNMLPYLAHSSCSIGDAVQL
jgi:hypothetical protein